MTSSKDKFKWVILAKDEAKDNKYKAGFGVIAGDKE